MIPVLKGDWHAKALLASRTKIDINLLYILDAFSNTICLAISYRA